MPRPVRTSIVTGALVAFAAAGCAHWFRSPPVGPTDANIAAILLAANNTDISYAQLAPTRARNAEVQRFAARMLAEHTGVNDLAVNLFTRLNLTPKENVTSLDFRDESAAKRDTLRELSGASFDSAYAVNEVGYHTRLLVAIDSVLIPSARDPELKKLLQSVRPAVAVHLEHALRVRAMVVR